MVGGVSVMMVMDVCLGGKCCDDMVVALLQYSTVHENTVMQWYIVCGITRSGTGRGQKFHENEGVSVW